jgi:MYND finger
MILERHAANPLLNGSGASELHVAAQSTVCPARTCTDIDRWAHAHRMVLGAGFHVDQHEGFMSNGMLDLDAVARGRPEAVRRFDVVTRRVDQKGREFARTWTPEKSLLSFRTIRVLSDDASVAQCVGVPGAGAAEMAELGEIERLLVDGKPIPGLDSLFVSAAAQQLWRRRFLSQMEGRRWSSLQARLKALKRAMDIERAAGLHDVVWPYHALESEFGTVATHSEWLHLAARRRSWSREARTGPSVCSLCHMRAEEGQKFPVCGKCRLAEYCCRNHQRDDWNAHKAYCRKWAEQTKGPAAAAGSTV